MKLLPAENTYYFYRGRVALYALLQSLGIQPNDEVLIPGFTCVAVPSPILGLQGKPVYLDIDPRTYNITVTELKRNITSRSRVVIVQHTFGIPCDMDPIMEVAKNHGLTVIEDACHVWGSKYKGKEVGSIGAAAFYSYDPGKPFIIGMGGAATVNSDELNREMRRLYGQFGKPRMLDTAKLHIQYFAHRLTRHPHLFWQARDIYRSLSRSGVAVGTWTPDTLEGTVGPDYKNGLAPSLRRRLNAMVRDGDSVVSRHKRLAGLYEQGLRTMGISGLRTDYPCEPALICYPIQVTNKVGLLEQARRARVELGDWFSSPVHPLSEKDWKAVQYSAGSCPVAERVSKCIVTLPCHAGVTRREVERTLTFLSRMRERGLLTEESRPKVATIEDFITSASVLTVERPPSGALTIGRES